MKRLALAVFLFCTSVSHAALSPNTIWQIKKGATSANANGGGFDWGSKFFMTDLADQGSVANTAAPVVGSPSYVFVSSDVGHWVFVSTTTGSTWIPGFYQIASVSASSATLNAATGSSVWIDTTTGSPSPRFYPSTGNGIATTASPTGGTFGVDYSQSTGPVVAYTDIAVSAATGTEITSAAFPFTNSHTGNILHILAAGTTYWIGITSVTATNTAVLEKSAGAAGSTGVSGNLGGAMSLNSVTAGRTDDILFENASSTNGVGAHRFFISSGTYTTQLINISAAATGGTRQPIIIEGYGVVRGDIPRSTVESSTAPILSFVSGSGITVGTNWDVYNVTIKTDATNGINAGASSKFVNIKSYQTSTTLGRTAITMAANATCLGCEAVAYKGNGILLAGGNSSIVDSYAHNSRVGISGTTGTNGGQIIGSIIEHCYRSAIEANVTAETGRFLIHGNTLFGYRIQPQNQIGLRITPTGHTNIWLSNSIISGFAIGVAHTDIQTAGYDDYNNFYDNTVDVSSEAVTATTSLPEFWQKGPHDTSGDPGYASVTITSGTTGAFVAANSRLVDTTKDFSALGVYASTPSVFFVSISTGSVVTNYDMWAGITGITTTTNPNDTLTLDIAQGTNTTANKVYYIGMTHNFMPSQTLKGSAHIPLFPGGYVSQYPYPGAIQRNQSGTLATVQ